MTSILGAWVYTDGIRARATSGVGVECGSDISIVRTLPGSLDTATEAHRLEHSVLCFDFFFCLKRWQELCPIIFCFEFSEPALSVQHDFLFEKSREGSLKFFF